MSSRIRFVLILAGLLTLVGTAALRLGGTSDAAVSSTLHASVGPAFDISLTFDDGTPANALPPGSYRILVNDVTPDHNFHIYGPGVEQETQVDFVGTATWNVTFRAGSRYQYVCDLHADSMSGRVDAGTVVEDVAPSTGGGGGSSSSGGGKTGGGTAGAPSVLGTVAANLTSAGKLKLTLKGKSVKTLAAGKYTLVVTDSSTKNDVTLRRIGAAAKKLTGLPFVGKKTVTVTLAAGQWKLYSSPHEAATAVALRVTKA